MDNSKSSIEREPFVVDVGAVLDVARFRGLPLLVMVCTALIMVLDGFDIQIIGFAAPAIAAEFHIERSALAPALAASLIGMAVGAFTIGPVGDRYGRRNALLLSILVFGLGTLVAATAPSVAVLTAWRFMTGLGLGGALPNATALMAEFAPPRVRSQSIAAAIVGVPLGGMIGAAIAADLIPALGWRALFVLGGILPLVAFAFFYFVLPESARYLALYPQRRAELANMLNKISGESRFSHRDSFLVLARQSGAASEPREVDGATGIFERGILPDTIATWTMFATNLFAVYCFFSWTPVMLTSLGMDIGTAVRGSLAFNAAGVVGAIVSAWLIARFGSRWPVAIVGLLGASAVWYVGRLIGGAENAGGNAADLIPVTSAMSGIAIAGFAIVGTQVAMFSIAAHVYPTACRSTGVGWAAGVGRLGAVLSTFAGAALMARGGVSGFFSVVTGVLGLTVFAVLVLRRHLPATLTRSRDPVSGAYRTG